jgi:hypothetical protein
VASAKKRAQDKAASDKRDADYQNRYQNCLEASGDPHNVDVEDACYLKAYGTKPPWR